jgi:hypothetical protein
MLNQSASPFTLSPPLYPSTLHLKHGFILPGNLRPCKLVGTGSAGVVLCCTTERGELVAVKKIRSETEQGLHRSLREVFTLFLAVLKRRYQHVTI